MQKRPGAPGRKRTGSNPPQPATRRTRQPADTYLDWDAEEDEDTREAAADAVGAKPHNIATPGQAADAGPKPGAGPKPSAGPKPDAGVAPPGDLAGRCPLANLLTSFGSNLTGGSLAAAGLAGGGPAGGGPGGISHAGVGPSGLPQASLPQAGLTRGAAGSPLRQLEAAADEFVGEHSGEFMGDCPESACPPPPPPPCPPPPSAKDRLMHAIAFEELAIAALINAEAEKAQAVARQPMSMLTPDEVIAFQHSVAEVLGMAVEKEKLLLKKLRLILFEVERIEECE